MITDTHVERWLREDLGHHDVTNDVPGRSTGDLVATEPGVVAGVEAAQAVFEYLDCRVERDVRAGDRVARGDALLTVEGPSRDVLRGERAATNVAAHASGVATKTARAVAAAEEAAAVDPANEEAGAATDEAETDEAAAVESPPRIACTRKTTPGLRGVEKRAVAAAGGDTHRLDLSHMVMVKDNHVAAMGLETAIERFRERASFATKIEAEVEDPEDAPRAAAAGADVVLLDNMSPAETERAVDLLREGEGDAIAEASGGIEVSDVPDYVRTGVDVISMGALTHSADALDLSFRTE